MGYRDFLQGCCQGRTLSYYSEETLSFTIYPYHGTSQQPSIGIFLGDYMGTTAGIHSFIALYTYIHAHMHASKAILISYRMLEKSPGFVRLLHRAPAKCKPVPEPDKTQRIHEPTWKGALIRLLSCLKELPS